MFKKCVRVKFSDLLVFANISICCLSQPLADENFIHQGIALCQGRFSLLTSGRTSSRRYSLRSAGSLVLSLFSRIIHPTTSLSIFSRLSQPAPETLRSHRDDINNRFKSLPSSTNQVRLEPTLYNLVAISEQRPPENR